MSYVRRAVEGDLEAVHPLLDQLLTAEFARRQAVWRDAFAQDDFAAWVAEVDGRPAGFLDLILFPDVAHGGKIGVINNLVVDAPVRGRGLGTRLLREAIHYSRQRGAVELHVWTDFDNTAALELYESVGFVRRAMLLELQF